MFVELFVSFFTALIIWDYLYKRRRNQMLDETGIPGPKPLPILGNILKLVGNDTSNVFALLQSLNDEYGKIVRLWLVNDCALVIKDAKYFESILSSQQVIAKNDKYSLLTCWLGSGLLLSTGSKWFSRRKIITPTFHFKILDRFSEVFDQQSCVMVNRLYAKADGETSINIFPEICLTALDIIAETAMGVKINAQEHPEFKYAKAVTDTADIIAMRFMTAFDRFDWFFKTFSYQSYQKLNECIKTMHDFTDKVIEERRDALQKSIEDGTFHSENNETEDVGVKKRMALLDVLLQSTISGQPLTNMDIREEVDTFMFEGHDTTTSGISFTCYLLSRHPEVQKKVFEEVLEVIGDDKDRPVTMRQLQDLKYLDCVIKESLRLYPSVPMIGRTTEQDVIINGKTIPANTNFILLLYAACRDPDYFAKPDDFLPERFTEDSDKINPFAYVPFSAGPRNCIGQKFAILEMKSAISKMVRHFELLPLGEEVRPVMNIILRSANGINIGLKPRKY